VRKGVLGVHLESGIAVGEGERAFYACVLTLPSPFGFPAAVLADRFQMGWAGYPFRSQGLAALESQLVLTLALWLQGLEVAQGAVTLRQVVSPAVAHSHLGSALSGLQLGLGASYC
jgi:hypothetical protein